MAKKKKKKTNNQPRAINTNIATHVRDSAEKVKLPQATNTNTPPYSVVYQGLAQQWQVTKKSRFLCACADPAAYFLLPEVTNRK